MTTYEPAGFFLLRTALLPLSPGAGTVRVADLPDDQVFEALDDPLVMTAVRLASRSLAETLELIRSGVMVPPPEGNGPRRLFVAT